MLIMFDSSADYDGQCFNDIAFNPFSNYDKHDQEFDPDTNFFSSNLFTCNYYQPCKFANLIRNINNYKTFSSLHINSRSLTQNIDSFKLLLNTLKYDFDVIGVSETWLKYNNPLVHIPCYTLVSNHRIGRAGGGVALYIRDGQTFKERTNLTMHPSLCESLFIEVENPSGKNIIVGIIYRAPSLDSKSFIDAFDLLLHDLSTEDKQVYVLGDFNIDLLKYETNDNISQNFVNSLFSNYFIPTINRHTRITPTTATLLDNIISNKYESTLTGLLYSDISDHLPIFNITPLCTNYRNDSKKLSYTRRKINENTITNFIVELEGAPWTEVYQTNDPHIAFNLFESEFRNLFDKHFPFFEQPARKKKLKSWMTDGILISVKHKNKLYAKSLHHPSNKNINNYKQFRNKLNSVIRTAKRDFYEEQFNQQKSNIKGTWKIINSLLKKKECGDPCCEIICDGTPSNDACKIANHFNNYFVNIGPTMSSNIDQTDTNFQSYLPPPCINSIFLNPVCTQEIIGIVNGFENSKAPGIDGINSSILKKCIHLISEPLSFIFNLCLSNGVFPDSLKMAIVTPIYKSGDKAISTNYRPISVLPVFSKILERLIYDRTYNFLQKNNILHPNQFGFRKNYNTSTALLQLIQMILLEPLRIMNFQLVSLLTSLRLLILSTMIFYFINFHIMEFAALHIIFLKVT